MFHNDGSYRASYMADSLLKLGTDARQIEALMRRGDADAMKQALFMIGELADKLEGKP